MSVQSVSRSPRKAKGAGHLRRAEILDAAQRIFIALGYEGATIRKIAEAVGLSSTALYMHFEDKAAILGEICDGTLNLLLERNQEIAARPLPAAERVRAMLEAHMRWALENPYTYQLVYAAPRPESVSHWPEGAAAISLRSFEIFSSVVREAAAENPEAVAQVLWMSCHGVVSLLNAHPHFPWVDQEQLMTLTLESLMSGLLAH